MLGIREQEEDDCSPFHRWATEAGAGHMSCSEIMFFKSETLIPQEPQIQPPNHASSHELFIKQLLLCSWSCTKHFCLPNRVKLKPTKKKREREIAKACWGVSSSPAVPPAPKLPPFSKLSLQSKNFCKPKKLLNCLKLIPWFY